MNISGINTQTNEAQSGIAVHNRPIIGNDKLFKCHTATRFHIDVATGLIHNVKAVYTFIKTN